MRKTAVRTAYNDSELPPDFCYLKIDVEKRFVKIKKERTAFKQLYIDL